MNKEITAKLSIQYYPIVNLVYSKTVAYEARMRLQEKGIGKVEQDEVMLVAEKSGLSANLSKWRLEEIAKNIRTRIEKSEKFDYISFDVLLRSLRRKNYEAMAEEIVAEYGIMTQKVCLSIKESYFNTDRENIIKKMFEFKKGGFMVAIDDYTGNFLPIAELEGLPIDIIKVARSVTDRMIQEGRLIEELGYVVKAFKELGIEVIAKGITEKDLLGFLMGAGCQLVQEEPN